MTRIQEEEEEESAVGHADPHFHLVTVSVYRASAY